MRIILLSYEYPPDTGFGGIGTYTWYQARALARLGHDVHVVAGATSPGIHRSEHDGVQVTRVADDAFLGGAVDGMLARGMGWAANRLQTAAGAHVVVRDLLELDEVDIVEYPECGADGMLVSTLLSVRAAVRFHSPARLIMGHYGADAVDVEAASFFEQVAINQATIRIAPSSFLAREVVDHLAVPPPVHVVPNGIDLDLFDRSPGLDVTERFGLPGPGALTVLFSSRLERRKGVHLLGDVVLPTLRAYPHVHFVLAGADVEGVLEGEIRPRVEAEGHGDRLHALGRLSLGEVRAVLKQVDVHLLPSLWENAPYACIEAMAAGRAVLASDCGGMPDLIDHEESGLLAATGDAASFASHLARLVEDRDLRDRLGRGARRAVEQRFTDVAVARRTVDVWRRAIAEEA